MMTNGSRLLQHTNIITSINCKFSNHNSNTYTSIVQCMYVYGSKYVPVWQIYNSSLFFTVLMIQRTRSLIRQKSVPSRSNDIFISLAYFICIARVQLCSFTYRIFSCLAPTTARLNKSGRIVGGYRCLLPASLCPGRFISSLTPFHLASFSPREFIRCANFYVSTRSNSERCVPRD